MMTQPRSNTSSHFRLTEVDMADIIKSLTQDLIPIEDEMVVAWRTGKSKVHSESSRRYVTCIHDLVARLRSIASALFNDTEISKVKDYKKTDTVPENYDKYLRVSENLSLLVSQDILYQPDVDHAVATFDRWLYVCKIAFHKHDFFTACCILYGLNSESVIYSNIEKQLSPVSATMFKYYCNILDKSSSLYHKQLKLLKNNLEVIPVFHALTNLYAKLGETNAKNDKSGTRQLEEIAVKKRAVSRNFTFMQRKSMPELDVLNEKLLAKLYHKFYVTLSIIRNSQGKKEELSNFDIRSRMLRKLIANIRNNTKVVNTTCASSTKLAQTRFSIASYSGLNDERAELISIWHTLGELEDAYDAPIEDIIYRVKSILVDVQLTDNSMRHKIADIIDLSDLVFDRKLLNIFKRINQILLGLIKYEIAFGIFVQEDELKLTLSSDDSKLHSCASKSKEILTDISESRQAFEESTPKILSKHILMESELPESESGSSSSDFVLKKLVIHSSPKLVPESPPIPVSAPDASGLTLSDSEQSVPRVGSFFQIFSGLTRFNSSRQSDSEPPHHSELEESALSGSGNSRVSI